jgi:hypothetical protein
LWRFQFWLTLALLCCLLTVASLHRSQPGVRELLVEYRNSATGQQSSARALFTLSSSELVERGFLTDSAEAAADWQSRLATAARVPSDTLPVDDVSKAKAIVNSFSRGGGQRPIYFLPLLERITAAQQASGYCSDHVKIFMALSRAYGVFARETQNRVHGFADFYSASRNKWIFVDPMYAILATDDAGTYLSSLELRERRLSDLPVHFVFFGVPGVGIHSEDDPRFKPLYDKSNFTRYVLTFGNNVLTEASRSARLAWLPWEARQLIFYATGTKPTFVQLADRYVEQPRVSSARARALGFYGVVGYVALALTAYPLLLAHGRIKALNGEDPVRVSAEHTLSGAAGMGSAHDK